MKMGLGWGIGGAIAMLVMILDGKIALAGAATGIELCIRTVIPGLFPFLILSQWINYCLADRPIKRRILKLPKGCEGIAVAAFLGGYPVGARAVGQAFHRGQISKHQGEKLLSYCNQPGPAFIFGIAAAMFSESWAGWALWAIQILGAFIISKCIPIPTESNSFFLPKNSTQEDPMTGAVKTMGIICGWVVLFRILLEFLEQWVLWILPNTIRVLVYGILELSNGCCLLGRIQDEPVRFMMCAGMLSAGGLCVMMQTASVTSGLRLTWYLLGKGLQILISIALSWLFLRIL